MANSTNGSKPATKQSAAAEVTPKSMPKTKASVKSASVASKKSATSSPKAAPRKSSAKVKKATAKLPVTTKAMATPKEKAKKPKLVRDSFTMPEAEYAALSEVKKACLKAGIEVKKSELLRAGVAHIRKMDLAVLKQALAALTPLKAGRPKKDK